MGLKEIRLASLNVGRSFEIAVDFDRFRIFKTFRIDSTRAEVAAKLRELADDVDDSEKDVNPEKDVCETHAFV